MKHLALWLVAARTKLAQVWRDQKGSILSAIVVVALALIVLGALIPALWPMLQATTGNITAISGTDTPTVFLKAMWPVALLVTGLGIVIAIILYAMKKFGVMGGRGRGV